MDKVGMAAIRKNNTQNRILHIIRSKGKVSKMDIKKISRYSMVTVLDTIDAMVERGLVYYAEKVNTKSGRKPTYITLNPQGGYFLGLSFNATEITLTMLDFCGGTLDFEKMTLESRKLSVEYVLGQLYLLLEDMLGRHRDIREKIMGIGVGTPGYVDELNGLCIFYPHIAQWQNIPLKALLEERVPDIPIYVENNSNAMALAYKWLCPEGADTTSIIVSIRSGVRMSCLISNVLYRGKNFTAGEIGHIRVNGGSRYCPCGKQGCLETEISEKAIVEKILEGVRVNRFINLWEMAGQDETRVDMNLFIESVRRGHPDSIALLDELCDYLGDTVTQIVNMFNPSNVFFNARISDLGDIFYDRMNAIVRERAIFVALDGLTLAPVAFGNKTAAIGAATIVMERELSFVDATI